MSDTLNFVLAHPNDAADRIEALEAALHDVAVTTQAPESSRRIEDDLNKVADEVANEGMTYRAARIRQGAIHLAFLRHTRDAAQPPRDAAARIEALEAAVRRSRTVLGNMAVENEGAIFNRWPINHEPLRNDARNLLPDIDDALAPETDK